MVHPNTGANSGTPMVRCHFSGIKWIESPDPNKTTEQYRQELFESRARTVDLGVEKTTDNFNQAAYSDYEGSTFTFIGNSAPETPEKPKKAEQPEEPKEVDNPGPEPSRPTLEMEPWETHYLTKWQWEDPQNLEHYIQVSAQNGWFDGNTPTQADMDNDIYYKAHRTEIIQGWTVYNAWSAQNDKYQAYLTALAEYNSYDPGVAETEYQAALEQWESSLSGNCVVIPTNAYFLGRVGRGWPKFYREISTNESRTTGLWTQYTAVINPNSQAVSTIEAELDGTSQSSAGVNMIFDEDFDGMYDPTEIKEIVADAEKKGQKVEYMDIVISINGQVVRRGSTSLEGLPTGLYIVNGKKYYVK
jgi:hypothetical protein